MLVYRGALVERSRDRPVVTSLPRGPRALFVIVCGRCDRWLVFGCAPGDCAAAGVSLLQCPACRSCNDLTAAVQHPDDRRHPIADAEPWNRYAYATWPTVPAPDDAPRLVLR